jgi:tetratricopeptide (TPR) repeat protein
MIVYFELEVLKMRKPTRKRFQIDNAERKKRAVACRSRGRELFKDGKFLDAAKQYRDCSDYSSCVTPTEDREFVRDVRVPGNLDAAVSFMRLERWHDGLQFCELALALDRDSVKGMFLKAQCLGKQSKWEDAMQTIVKAVKANPTSRKVSPLFCGVVEMPKRV